MEGTWQVADRNSFEHWDLLKPNSLRGVMFKMEMGLPVVSEYLEIRQLGEDFIYTATVLNQNQGEGIPFVLEQADSCYSFENPEHDFPKIIRYKPVTENRISVFVGTELEGVAFDLIRTGSRQIDLNQKVNSMIDTLASGELMLSQELVINVPLQKVWEAYTTAEIWKEWVSPVVEMDFRVNGTIRSHYDPAASIGDEGTIIIHILNYLPDKQITMQAEIGKGFPEFIREHAKNLYSIVEFERIHDSSTRIRLIGIGYRNDPQWLEFMKFFIQGNEMTLNNLKNFLEPD
jgi:hypothetical protein